MKFSLIIPVYNVYAYLEKCLASIENQSYKNFEVIIVNDGSPDNSQEIINKYCQKYKNFKSYNKENGGLSSARNFGLQYVTGDYIVFIDSDDYIKSDYLEKINATLITNKDIEVLKLKLILVDELGKEIRKESGLDINGYITFKDLTALEFIEPAWSYVYSTKFWKKYKFKYMEGKIHEDFGLTPEILMRANKIYYLSYYGYYYVQRKNSIMSSNDKEKLKKKAYDMLEQYDRLISLRFNKDNTNITFYKSFLANALINKAKTLKGLTKKQYIKELKYRKVSNLILSNTFKRKIKKIILKLKY